MRQDPVNEIGANFAAGLLGTAREPQFLAPELSKYDHAGLAGIFQTVCAYIAADDQINPAAECLSGEAPMPGSRLFFYSSTDVSL